MKHLYKRELLERVEILEASIKRVDALLFEMDGWVVAHNDQHRAEVANHLGLHRALEVVNQKGASN